MTNDQVGRGPAGHAEFQHGDTEDTETRGEEGYRRQEAAKNEGLTREFPAPGWSYREEGQHFLARMRSGEPFDSTARDTLADVRLFEDVYRRVA